PDNKQAIFVTGPDTDPENGFVVRGQKGFLSMRGAGLTLFDAKGMSVQEAKPEPLGGFGAVCRELFSAVDNKTPMVCGADRCALATEMAYAAHESARTMRRIEFPLPVRFAPLEVVQARPFPRLAEGKIVLFADEHFKSGGREGIVEALADHAGRTAIVID